MSLVKLQDLLSNVNVYIWLQRALGADRLRYRCIEALAPTRGETVVDVGCGPAYYFDSLPQPLDYVGFDTDSHYIEWARARWGDRARFHVGEFDREHAAEIAPVDGVLLLGVIHHLSDHASLKLLDLIAESLTPSGRVVSVDTCFEPSQSRVARWFAENDRGEYVREPERYLEMARRSFGDVRGESLSDVTRIPGSYWMMTMSTPMPKVEG